MRTHGPAGSINKALSHESRGRALFCFTTNPTTQLETGGKTMVDLKKKLGPGDDLEMMQSPDLWPQWPVLPMKKRDDHNRPGVLVEVLFKSSYAWVPGATMFEKIKLNDPRLVLISKGDTAALQAILDDSWVVD